MGGYGSGRWGRHSAKQTVEDGLSLPTTHLRKGLNHVADGGFGWYGSLEWGINGKVTSSISYRIRREVSRPVVQLVYTTTRSGGTKIDSDYSVEVVATTPAFGGRHWWWVCPLVKNGRACGRKAAKLYLPPGSIYFGCRQCHELTYTSCQESHKYDHIWDLLASSMSDEYPGVTGKDVGRLMSEMYHR